MFHFSEKSVWSTCLDIFSQVGVKSGVSKTASILSSRIAGFFYSPRSYMMNVFYLLTQPVAPPRGHHRNGQERCPTDWKNVVMPQILFGRVFIVWYYCRIILLLNWRRRLYFLLTNIVVDNEILRFIIIYNWMWGVIFIWLNKYIIINTHKLLLYLIF